MKTWLYIKQHNKTGLKYFGKTCRDPLVYNGSGKRWLNHLRTHGKDISTIWCQEFDDKETLIEFALRFSVQHNIVESGEWANLILENGVDGSVVGTKHSEETKKKISQNTINTHKGQVAWNKNKTISEEHRLKLVTGQLQYRQAHPEWKEQIKEAKIIGEKKRLEAVQKKTIVNEIEYSSATIAANTLGIKKITLIKRVLSKNFPTYYYKE